MRETISFVTSFGAFAPGMSTEPMTRSEAMTARSRSRGFEAAVFTRPWKWSSRKRSRAMFVSKIVTSAPRPAAITAEFAPATPPPTIVTVAGRVPGTPDMRRPRPPAERIRVAAPTVGARRPATSLIGARSGSPPPSSCTVSYAIAVTPSAVRRSVSGRSAARCRYVKITRSSRKYPYSAAIGSLTFNSSSARPHTSAGSSTSVAPAASYSASDIDEPTPAPRCTSTS